MAGIDSAASGCGCLLGNALTHAGKDGERGRLGDSGALLEDKALRYDHRAVSVRGRTRRGAA
jgi:hypothetical protein